MRTTAATAALLALACGCAAAPLPPVRVQLPERPIHYLSEVKPLLERRCTVCHSCYNSPCQVKLDSYEGLDRGTTKKAVYDASRLSTMEPSRLFTDAATTAEWRKKGFTSVTESKASGGLNDSLMLQLLDHKRRNPRSAGSYRPEADDLTCAKDGSELAGFLEKHPNRGMPFGFPPLKQEEFELLAGWLAQGAHGPSPAEQRALEAPSPEGAAEAARWEAFLNQDDPKHAMTARYLYEHLFLAHLKFATPVTEYFELVRSRSAPGTPLELVATVRPYDDPGAPRVYYRLRKIHSTIVQKTHMVFTLDDARLRRLQALFIQPEWLQPPHLVGYEPRLSANPFKAFEQIPPRARYEFLLDANHYVLMTFIHGPVCKGQIALNVINDHFWVMFLDPDHDPSIRNPGFLRLQADQLAMPHERGSDNGLFSAVNDVHRDRAVRYYQARQDLVAALNYGGLGLDAIWHGRAGADAPVQTVYRHFDSASVHPGPLGGLPKTLWVIDYPLFERIYYSLVAGFDVYGTVGHQLATRLYMDRLRIEGESYFLDLLPPEARPELMKSWYLDTKLSALDYHPASMPAAIAFETKDPKRELVERLVERELGPASGVAFDPINYLRAGQPYPPMPARFETPADYLQGLRAVSRPGAPFVRLVNDHEANLAYLRVRRAAGKDLVFTVVVNRWHDDISFFLGEDRRLDPRKDQLEFVPGMIGSYPNMFFDVPEEEIPAFLLLLDGFSDVEADRRRLSRWAINRADDRFWETYDWFQRRFDEDEPVHGGLLDLNRYFHEAR